MNDFRVQKIIDGTFAVSLPHQCDAWDIAGEAHYRGVSQEVAIETLTEFIEDAQRALAALTRGETYG